MKTTALVGELVDSGDASGALPVIRYSVTDQQLAAIEAEYMPLRIKGVDDKSGYDVVHRARMDVRNLRVAVDKTRKELKADALAFTRAVDSEARRITDRLSPVETHLQQQEADYKAACEEIKRAAEKAAQQKLDDRLERLRQVEKMLHPVLVEAWTDEEFERELQTATEEFQQKQAQAEAEAARLREQAEQLERERAELERLKAEASEREAEQRRQEAEKLAAERAELERKRAEQEQQAAAERARLAAEQQRQREEQARLEAEQRRLDEERIARDAAEKARLEEQQRIERERLQAEESVRLQAEADARREQQRPDLEKLRSVADAVAEIRVPAVSEELAGLRQMVVDLLNDAQAAIRNVTAE